MAVFFENDWQELLKDEFNKPFYLTLRKNLAQEYRNHIVYPDMYDIFNAFSLTSFEDTKVVILGQDPYHEPGQAHGLSFSVPKGEEIPKSLVNIYKELESDLGIAPANHGCLVKWAKEGVLLLNSVLTVRAHEAGSHRYLGWETFTDDVIKMLNDREKPVCFILWGSYAISKEELITNPRHGIIKSVHPSPLSAYRGFFGSRPFSRANEFLVKNNIEPIDWDVNY